MSESYEVEFVDEERTIEVDSTEPILEAGENAGIDLPYQCRMGFCGVCCARRVEDGQVNQRDGMFLSEEEKADGYVLTCVGKPCSDLKLRSNEGP